MDMTDLLAWKDIDDAPDDVPLVVIQSLGLGHMRLPAFIVKRGDLQFWWPDMNAASTFFDLWLCEIPPEPKTA